MSGIDFEVRMKDAEFIAQLLRGAAAQGKLTEKVSGTAKESRRAEQELARFAAQTRKIDATPWERYTDQLGKLKKALEAGKLQQYEYERAVKRLQAAQKEGDPGYQQLLKSIEAKKRATEEEKKLAAATEARLKDEWLKRLRQNTAELERQEEAMDRLAESVRKVNATPLERYNQEVEKLNNLRERGKLTEEEHARAMAAEKAALDKANPALQEQIRVRNEWQKQLRQNSVELEREEENLERMADAIRQVNATPLERYNQEVAKLNNLRARGKLTAEDHARAMAKEKAAYQQANLAAAEAKNKGIGTAMEIAGAFGMATSAASAVSLAMSKINAAFERQSELVNRAKEGLSKLVDPRIAINQVSATPEEYEARMSRIRKASAAAGIDEATGTEIYSDAIAAGSEDQYEKILMASQGVMGHLDAGVVATKMKALFGLSVDESLSMMVKAASGKDGDVIENVTQMTGGLAKAALGAKEAGSSAAEGLAIQSVFSDMMGGNSTRAGDLMAELGLKMGRDERTAGKGLLGGALHMKATFTPEELHKWLGEDQSKNEAFNKLISGEALIRERTGLNEAERLKALAGNGISQTKRAQYLANAENRAELDSRIAKEQANAANMDRNAVFGANQAAGMSRAEQESLQRGDGILSQGVGFQVAQGAMKLGAPGWALPMIHQSAGAGAETSIFKMMLGPFSNAGTDLALAARELRGAAGDLKRQQQSNLHAAANADAKRPLNSE
jgi:hypothetical protein